MNLASVVGWIFAAPALPVFTVFLTETFLGLLRPRKEAAGGLDAMQTTVLMPAHNEGQCLAATIAAFQSVSDDNTKLLIVADNCTDDTARIAREMGVTVIERNEPAFRGKGYALAFGRDFLRSAPPDCVIVLDADCHAAKGTFALLTAKALASGKPCQANNLILADLAAKPLVQISNFAFLVKNLIRQRGARHIGSAALLTGTGMAFPWSVFADAPLASGDIVEDLGLGIHLTRAGHIPQFIEHALVTSEAADERDTITQRTRWEHGFLRTALFEGLPLVREGVSTGSWPAFWLGLHLMVPPLALLFSASIAMAGFLFLLGWLAGGAYGPFAAVAGALALAGVAVLLAWFFEGRKTLAFATLLRVPIYILWKIPVYLKLARGGETQWVRTNRKGE